MVLASLRCQEVLLSATLNGSCIVIALKQEVREEGQAMQHLCTLCVQKIAA